MENEIKKIHFIAIGGSIMHNLAIALHNKGLIVTGSDDHFFEPSKSKLQKYGLLPAKEGWNAEKITTEIDAIILGMHAKIDNPELLKAQELGLKIYSFPDFIYEQSKNKQRLVIGGSHGKTTITSMVMHVLNHYNKKFDYAVGAQVDGFETMVKLSHDAPIIVIEGDEYLTSPLDLTPKFHKYHHHIGLISGIAWDHMNVFPTFDEYVKQFEIFAKNTPRAGSLIVNKEDLITANLIDVCENEINKFSYNLPDYEIVNGVTSILFDSEKYALNVFGKHNLLNIEAARLLCNRVAITDKDFYKAIQSFKGAGKRLESLGKSDSLSIYKDFAHSPSKLKATAHGVKEQFPERKVCALMELHTFSSLNKEFLSQYKNAFGNVDTPVVFFDPNTVANKGLEIITEDEIKDAFDEKNLQVFTDSKKLETFIKSKDLNNHVLLLMSSGNWGGMNLTELSSELLNKY